MNEQYLSRGKRLDTGEWVEGYILPTQDGRVCINYKDCLPIFNCSAGITFSHIIGNGRPEVDPATLGRCTGLRDKHGTPIFEGDIVQFTYWYFDGNITDSFLTGEIIYLPEFMSYGLRGVKNKDWIRHIGGEDGSSDTAPFALWTFDEADFEIIGSIWENPELMEVRGK